MKLLKQLGLQFTVFNVLLILYLLALAGYVLIYWEFIKIAPDFDINLIYYAFLIGFIGLVIDFILQKIIKNKLYLNLTGAIIALILGVLFFENLW